MSLSFIIGVDNTLACNLKRTADVWLDQFSQIFYLTQSPSRQSLDCGDVSKRKQMRKDMKCKSFQWYLENVYPQLQVLILITKGICFLCAMMRSNVFQLPRDTDLAFGELHYSQPGFLKCVDSIGSISD